MDRQKLIAAKIRQAREELGLSQEELGKIYGCSGAAISQIERSVRGINLTSLERLADKLGKPLAWFLSDNIQPQPRHPSVALADLEVSIGAYIPVYAEVSAGEGIEPIDYVACTRTKLAPNSLRAYRVKGLCLLPEVIEGDTLIVDTAQAPDNNNLVVVIIDGLASVKRYRNDGNDKWLENNDGKFKPEDVYLHGVVIGIYREVV